MGLTTCYTDITTTPLKWYKFEIFVRLPLSILSFFALLPTSVNTTQTFSSMGLSWFAVSFDIVLLSFFLLTLIAEIGLIRKNMSGIYSVIVLNVLLTLFQFYSIIIFAFVLHSPSNIIAQTIGQFICNCIFTALTALYFYKRRALFGVPLPAHIVSACPAHPISQTSIILPTTKAPPTVHQDYQSSTTLLAQLHAETEEARSASPSTASPADGKWRTPTKLLIGALGCVCVVLLVCCISVTTQMQSLNQSLAEQEARYNAQVDISIALLRQKKALEAELPQLREASQTLNRIAPAFNFWTESAVIVTTTGSRYHLYGCAHVANARFYIHNIENAEAQGYTSCLDCNSSNRTICLLPLSTLKLNGSLTADEYMKQYDITYKDISPLLRPALSSVLPFSMPRQ